MDDVLSVPLFLNVYDYGCCRVVVALAVELMHVFHHNRNNDHHIIAIISGAVLVLHKFWPMPLCCTCACCIFVYGYAHIINSIAFYYCCMSSFFSLLDWWELQAELKRTETRPVQQQKKKLYALNARDHVPFSIQ